MINTHTNRLDNKVGKGEMLHYDEKKKRLTLATALEGIVLVLPHLLFRLGKESKPSLMERRVENYLYTN